MTSDPNAGDALRDQGIAAVAAEDWALAASLFESAASTYRTEGSDRKAAAAEMGRANCLSELGDLRAARSLLESQLARLPQDDPLAVSVRANLAVCLARGGDVDGAADIWTECFDFYAARDDIEQAVLCLINIAKSLHDRGRDAEAIGAVGAARRVVHERAPGSPDLAAHCDSLASLCLLRLGNPEQAREAQQSALQTFAALGRQREVARCHGNLAMIMIDTDPTAARQHLDQSAEVLDADPDRLARDVTSFDALRTALQLEAGGRL